MILARRPALTLVWLIIGLALAIRLALPPGWMPVSDAGGIRVALCTEMGGPQRFIVIGRDGAVHPDTPAKPADPCPFGLVSTAALDVPPVLPGLPLPPAALAQQVLPALIAARLVAWRATRPPARGPPHRV